MTAKASRSYRFESLAQWHACLSHGITWMGSIPPISGVLSALFGEQPSRPVNEASSHVFFSPTGDLSWCENGERLCRRRAGLDTVECMRVPQAIRSSLRIAATEDFIWTLSPGSIINCLDIETRSLVRTFKLDMDVLDITAKELNSIYVLASTRAELETRAIEIDSVIPKAENIEPFIESVGSKDKLQLLSLDCDGQCTCLIDLPVLRDISSFAFLQSSGYVVIMTGGPCPELHWFVLSSGSHEFSVPVSRYSKCFQAILLGGNSRDELVLVGHNSDGGRELIVANADGQTMQTIPWDGDWGQATSLAGSLHELVVTSDKGLFVFRKCDTVPTHASAQVATILTPALRAPHTSSTGLWLRADLQVELPQDTRLEVVALSTDDSGIQDHIERTWNDRTTTSAQKWRNIVSHPELNRFAMSFEGASAHAEQRTSISVPLFDLRDEYLWIGLQLTAKSRAKLPCVNSLSVIYHGQSLIDHLPSIYQRDAAQRGSFLRSLVGILEKTTQSLDEEIRGLGARIRSSSQSHEWLDFVAQWFGLPWSQGLSLKQKQRLVDRAAEITEHRGTRHGLAVLMEAIVGDAERFRITDMTADFGFAILDGTQVDALGRRSTLRGCQLPALLAGSPHHPMAPETQTELDCVRHQPSSSMSDLAAQYCGRIRIELAATRSETDRWAGWISQLVQPYLPMGTSLDLCWVGPQALEGHCLTLGAELRPLPVTQLGTSAVTGRSTLPVSKTKSDHVGPVLPIRLK